MPDGEWTAILLKTLNYPSDVMGMAVDMRLGKVEMLSGIRTLCPGGNAGRGSMGAWAHGGGGELDVVTSLR